MDELTCWLALARAPATNRVKIRLLERYAGVQPLFASAGEIASTPNMSPELADYFRQPDWANASADRDWLASNGGQLIHRGHVNYPPLLAVIDDAPIVLFILGEIECLSAPQIAVVGSRNPSAAGLEHATEFSSALTRRGLVITSGLATGIDVAGHAAALAAGGRTVSVAGNGLDRVYPAAHAGLAARIRTSGALVSEFPPGTPPRAMNFPRRNRLISGLSLGVIVVEAAVRSGSLITARLAAEQGREVFAIPGSIDNPMSRGCHRLISEGAKLVECVDNVFEELGTMLLTNAALSASTRTIHVSAEYHDIKHSEDERMLLNALGHDSVSMDKLVERTGLTAEKVSSILLALEIHGHVSSAPGGMYSRATGIA